MRTNINLLNIPEDTKFRTLYFGIVAHEDKEKVTESSDLSAIEGIFEEIMKHADREAPVQAVSELEEKERKELDYICPTFFKKENKIMLFADYPDYEEYGYSALYIVEII